MSDSKTTSKTYDCIPSFRFSVSFTGIKGTSMPVEIGFSEVSGLNAELQTEEVTDGCALLSTYKLPKPVKYPNLVLKRALTVATHDLVNWVEEAIYKFKFSPCTVIVSLCAGGNDDKAGSESAVILRSWSLYNVYPVKVQISEFSSTKNEVVIETLELAYKELRRGK